MYVEHAPLTLNNKMFMEIISTDFLKFVAAKFSICSTFYWFILTKNENSNSFMLCLKT